ncbi:DoxX family protein [Cellulomonas sp. PhB150]|uniref:DoxX family protein n=1 Tax=Cellulomonas sp. PhB150 TaxID=2485188 RepID=UPI000F492694|nr:DoxX family protein [Cellulomonas sp. PhB150]ROS27738.1 thiosulfate dehydrogenase [quinone] large subunit [Cellulomonas sp. PhB150]
MTALRSAEVPTATVTESSVVTSSKARIALALARLATGFIFLWAFLDKTFGLHYSTGAAVAEGSPTASWINGGTPSQGFMKFGAIGPFKDVFANLASPLTDWLFMLGMLGVGVAVMLGIGLRVSAVAGSLIMAMMWVAEWPLQQGSTNPLIDYHVIYALVLVIAALTFAGDTWGLGRWWANLPIVQKHSWLR